MEKKVGFSIVFFILILTALISSLVLCRIKGGLTPTFKDDSGALNTPVPKKAAWVDLDNDGIADTLDQEITSRIANGTASDYANVTVMLKSAPTAYDASMFASCGGYLTTPLWTEAIYGFGGIIRYDDVTNFTEHCPDVLLIEKEAIGHDTLAYAAQQVGDRPYVWFTVGLEGDPNSSIAIADTGIDSSQTDFSPGYGDKNFSEKIVGWYDNITGTTTPFDNDGHGSAVSGIAAGNGFFSTDASGNAVATWGANLGSVDSAGTYLISGMMVNKTGTITLKVKWATTGTATLSALPLYYGGKTLNFGSWTPVASVSTPSQNTWYTLTYNVASTPSGGYDMYHVLMTLTAGTGNLSAVFTMSWPYTPPSDGFPTWTGIAPQTKLVGVKVVDYSGSVTSNSLINGINWIISNRMAYHITVASMSLGFDHEDTVVDQAVVNLVNSGVTTVAAAGNGGPGANYIYTPGSVDEVITVAAMNQFDEVTSYSSQGGTSNSAGQTVKPDITAPGGSFYAAPLFSADSNYNDAEGEWPDVQANDSAPMQGTSMAAPIVAGAANIMIQAMGGFAKWNWTRSQALLPKMILLMTATETYPNLREGGTQSTSPTLDRGGKDAQEGYGRLNLDAAADAVLRLPYTIGTKVTGTLGTPPNPSNISVLGQKLAWARNVQLVSGLKYNFTLSVPAGADYDIYLYNGTGTTYGEPSIVAKSTNATTGGTEQFWISAPYTGTYYVVVKTATEATGNGTFTLTSSGPLYVTFGQTGVSSDFTGTALTVDGTNYSVNSLPVSFWYDNGSSHPFAYQSPLLATANQKQYVWNSTSGLSSSQSGTIIVSANSSVTGNYKTQYYVTFSQTGVGSDLTGTMATIDGANHTVSDLPISFWYDNSSNHSFSYQSPLVVTAGQKQYIWISTNGLSPLQSGSITVSGNGTVTGNYKTQWWINVTSDHDMPTASAWVDNSSSFTASVTSPTEIVAGDHQWVSTGFNVDEGSSQAGTSYTFSNVQTAHSIAFNWKEQFWIQVMSTHDTPSPSAWVDQGSGLTVNVTSPADDDGMGTRYRCTGYTLDSNPQVTDGSTNYTFTSVQSSHSIAFNWVVQYRLAVNSDHDSPSPSGTSWYDSGAPVMASVTSPADQVGGTRCRCTGWLGTGSAPASGTGTSLIFTMTQSSNVTWNWIVQYLVTFVQTGVGADFTGTVVTVDGANYDILGASFWWDSQTIHSFSFQSPLVVNASQKRYIWSTSTGLSTKQNDNSFTANSSGNVTGSYLTQWYITFDQTDISPDFTGTIAVIDGSNYNVGNLPASFWYYDGSSHSFAYQSPLVVTASQKQYVWLSTNGLSTLQSSSITISRNGGVTGNYKAQWWIVVSSVHDTPTASAWVDNSSSFTASVTSPTEIVAGDHQWVCTGLSVNGGAPIAGTSYTFNSVQAAQTIVFNWKEQFWIQVQSAHDTSTVSQWVDQGGNFMASVTSPADIVFNDHQFVCTGYMVDGGSSVPGISYSFASVQAAHSIVFNWKEQFWIQVNSLHDSPTASQWVDQAGNLAVSVVSPADDDGLGTRYRCTGYTLDSNPPVTDGSTGYVFGNLQSSHVVTFNWVTQYRLMVASAYDSPSPSGISWYDSGTLITASVTSPAAQVGGTRYRCAGWTGTGSVPASGTGTSLTFTVTQPSYVTWNWISQYVVTFAQTGVGADFTGAVVTIDGMNYSLSFLPVSFWYDNGSSHSFAYGYSLIVTTEQERYGWSSTTGLSILQVGTITISGSGTVTGNYLTQFYVTFSQTGVDADFTGAVVTIDGANYSLDGSNTLPASFWWNNGSSHYNSFFSPLLVNASKQFKWTSTTGLTTLQNGTLNATGYGTVTGNYQRVLVGLQMSPPNKTCREYGEVFQVQVNVTDGFNMIGFRFDIQYNATLITVVGISWNAWGNGTYNVDTANGNLSGYTSGSPINGNLTLITITFNATCLHMWKSVPGWINDLAGTIYIQWANLSYPGSADISYVRGGTQNQINVGIDAIYTFSPIQGDINNDGVVGIFDLRTEAAYFDQQNPTYDLVGHNTIDIFDLVVIGANFGYTYTQ